MPNEQNPSPFGGSFAPDIKNDAVRLNIDGLHDLHQRLHQRIKIFLVEHFAQYLKGICIHKTAIPTLYTGSQIQQIGTHLRL